METTTTSIVTHTRTGKVVQTVPLLRLHHAVLAAREWPDQLAGMEKPRPNHPTCSVNDFALYVEKRFELTCEKKAGGFTPQEQRAILDWYQNGYGLEQALSRIRLATRTSASSGEIVWQRVAACLGYKASRTLAYLLSRRIPYRELADLRRDGYPVQTAEEVANLFFYMAPTTEAQNKEDWFKSNPCRAYVSDRRIPLSRRWFDGYGAATHRAFAAFFMLCFEHGGPVGWVDAGCPDKFITGKKMRERFDAEYDISALKILRESGELK